MGYETLLRTPAPAGFLPESTVVGRKSYVVEEEELDDKQMAKRGSKRTLKVADIDPATPTDEEVLEMMQDFLVLLSKNSNDEYEVYYDDALFAMTNMILK